MQFATRIVPCLWFDNQAEEAARFYTGIFPRGKITNTSHYFKSGQETHGRQAGSVLTVSFDLDGVSFTALNGGPAFKFNEAVSLMIMCDTQDEIDHFWSRLGAGGPVEAQQCGWLKDRFGVSWQVVPKPMLDWIVDPDARKAERVFAAMMDMKKLDIAALERARGGN